jgi:hypothetical protein
VAAPEVLEEQVLMLDNLDVDQWLLLDKVELAHL